MLVLLTSLLSSIGLTILVVWPDGGPAAFVRERMLRPLLGTWGGEVLDCYVCCGFWCGLVLSPVHWWMYQEPAVWLGCLMTPALFWLLLRPVSRDA